MKPSLLPIYDDPAVVKFAVEQGNVYWTAEEIKVEKDEQDYRVGLTPQERSGVISTLKLFSLYETHIGDEWWSGRFMRMFPRADYHRMAALFSAIELAVHAPFYNKINEILSINTPEFYHSYETDPVLVARMQCINDIIASSDDLVALGAFTFIEGTVLYSQFAYLKSFQSCGKNKIMNTIRGINFSVRDENLHALATAYAFREKTKGIHIGELRSAHKAIVDIVQLIVEHEHAIVSAQFGSGVLDNISAEDLQTFVMSRANLCMSYLNFDPLFQINHNPIADWFYKSINDFHSNDFFCGMSNQYNRNWNEAGFGWVRSA